MTKANFLVMMKMAKTNFHHWPNGECSQT